MISHSPHGTDETWRAATNSNVKLTNQRMADHAGSAAERATWLSLTAKWLRLAPNEHCVSARWTGEDSDRSD